MYGSSPRVWGIRNYFYEFSSTLWFIPTCVGNTEFTHKIKTFILVHPHVCGEYSILRPEIKNDNGSSPRVWGILLSFYREGNSPWFIPTCVGNTINRAVIESPILVHPHVCGEYIYFFFTQSGYTGSSPRVWGIPYLS